MPLEACPQCGQKVAGAAQVCPACSYRLSQHTPEIEGSGASWFALVFLGVALVVLGVLLAIQTRRDDGLQPSVSSAPSPAAPAAPAPPLSLADSVGPPPAAEPTTALPSSEIKWTSEWANVREGRALTAPILQILTPGQRVEVDSLRARWWLVYLDGQRIGYVHQTVIQDEEPADSVATDSVIG